MDFMEIVYEDVNWIYVAQDFVLWWPFWVR
jgi:hypothetical protein